MKRVATGLGLLAFLMLLMGGSLSAQVGERPRDSDYTEDAEDAIEDAEDTEDQAEKEASIGWLSSTQRLKLRRTRTIRSDTDWQL